MSRHLTARVVFKKIQKYEKEFNNKIIKNKCEHEDTSYSGNTENTFCKDNQYIHAGIIEPYDSRMIEIDKSYMLFTLKPDGFDRLPKLLDVETTLIYGLGLIKSKGSEFITGRENKNSKTTDENDKRVGKIYCYQHHTKMQSGKKVYSLFRFPFQELNEIYIETSSSEIKNKIENIVNGLAIKKEEKIFFRFQSHLIPVYLLHKYMNTLYNQIMFILSDSELLKLIEEKSKQLNLDFNDTDSIMFLNSSIYSLKDQLDNQFSPGLWSLVNYLNIKPKGELLDVLKFKKFYRRELFINKDIDQKYYEYTQGKFVLDFLPNYNLNEEQLKRILNQYGIEIGSNKKTQTIDFIKLNDFEKKDDLEQIIKNPYKLFEDYIQDENIPLTFEDIDYAEKSRLKYNFDKNNLYRLRALSVDYIKLQGKYNGDIWVHLSDLFEYIYSKLIELDNKNDDFYELTEIINSDVFKDYFEIDLEKKYITTKELANKEKYINKIILEKVSNKIDKNNDDLSTKLNNLDFVFVNGIAGSGKSYNLCKYLNKICDTSKFQVLSPTGKSANILRDKIKNEKDFTNINNFLNVNEDSISTVHKFLVDAGYWDYKLFSLIKKDDIQKIELDILIIDEISMISLELLYLILKATSAKKIFFFGDIKQLPSIDAGNIANSIYNYLKTIKSSSLIELTTIYRTNANSNLYEFSKYFRQEGIFQKDIINLSKKNDDSLDFYSYESLDDINNILEKIFKEVFEHNEYSKNILELSKLPNLNKLQIITPSNIGEFGNININNLIKENLGNDYKYNKTKENLKYIKLTNDNKTNTLNGMFGIGQSDKSILFENNQVEKFSKENHSLGYSITIHKSQGSGFDNVILIIPEDEISILTKELMYTAVTRASQKLYVLTYKNKFEIITQLKPENVRNMNIYDTDKNFWKKRMPAYLYFFNRKKYQTKKDLYFAILLYFNGYRKYIYKKDIFSLLNENEDYDCNNNYIPQNFSKHIVISNLFTKRKKEISNSGISEDINYINIRTFIKEFNLDINYDDKSENQIEDYIDKKREEKLKYNYVVNNQDVEITAHNGLKVRSWSEAIIMLILDYMKIDYDYEKQFNSMLPDFTINNGKLIIEHLGLLEDEKYFENWKNKKQKYESLGYIILEIDKINENTCFENLVVTTDESDISDIDFLLEKIKLIKSKS